MRILNIFLDNPRKVFENADLEEMTREISKGYLRNITWRLTNAGALIKEKVGRTNRYILDPDFGKPAFREFTFSIRIFDTSKLGAKHKWETEQDLEATVSGVAPIDLNEKQIKDKMNDNLFQIMRDILEQKGILPRVTIKGTPAVADDNILWRVVDKGISGVELGNEVDNYDPTFKYEVVYRNKQGIRYDAKNGFKDSDQVTLDEWT